MTLRLSPDLDVAALHAAFSEHQRLRIKGLFDPESAEALTSAMEAFNDWRITVFAGQDTFELPLKDRKAAEPDKQAWIDNVHADGESTRVQYVFDTRRLTVEGVPDHTPDAVSELPGFLNSAEFLDFVRKVTGDDRIDLADAQATRYRAGHVLTAHTDVAAGKNRLYAYVLTLTREWYADWGGNLIFFDKEGQIQEGYVPAFNGLNIFKVPKAHSVTEVASFAPRDRLSIVGWLRSNTPV